MILSRAGRGDVLDHLTKKTLALPHHLFIVSTVQALQGQHGHVERLGRRGIITGHQGVPPRIDHPCIVTQGGGIGGKSAVLDERLHKVG